MSTGGQPPKKPTLKALQNFAMTATALAAYTNVGANVGAAVGLPTADARSSVNVTIYDQVRSPLT